MPQQKSQVVPGMLKTQLETGNESASSREGVCDMGYYILRKPKGSRRGTPQEQTPGLL